MIIYKSCEIELKADKETRVVKGWASTFGNLDLGRDMMMDTAYDETIVERAGKIPVLWQHRSDQPIGTPRILKVVKEGKQTGLYFETYPLSDVPEANKALTLIKDKVVQGASVGISVQRQMWVEGDDEKGTRGYREIHKAKLWEFSLVTFPMNEEARLLSFKSADMIDKIRKGQLSDDELDKLRRALENNESKQAPDLTDLIGVISNFRRSLAS